LEVLPITPLSPEQATPPTRLVIPALDLEIEVVPMAWSVTEVAGQRQAVWAVPLDAAGWHINSAGAGAAGNVIISGHHLAGDAVFAPLARDGVKPGQQVILVDEDGRQFVYAVTEISAPIPAVGATEADQAQIASYLAPATQAQVTLLTGWPAFADTHYRMVVAALVGQIAAP
jgi:sortase (surface protein transpeptidase)